MKLRFFFKNDLVSLFYIFYFVINSHFSKTFAGLPNEIIENIFSYVSEIEDLTSLSFVSKKFYLIAQEEILKKAIIIKKSKDKKIKIISRPNFVYKPIHNRILLKKIEEIAYKEDIQKLKVQYKNFNKEEVEKIGEYLSLKMSIKEVDFSNSNLEFICKKLISNNFIKILNLNDNRFSNIKQERSDWIKSFKNTSLEVLDLSRNGLGINAYKILKKFLKKNTTLKKLNLSSNFINEAHVQSIIKVIKENHTLKTLCLDNNQITHKTIKSLIRSLENNKLLELTTLSLSSNFPYKKGSKLLAEFLKKNSSLTILDVSHNYLENIGIKYIIQALEYNSSLKVLDLEGIHLGENGVPYLEQALKKNSSLTVLNLSSNGITDMKAFNLMEALKINNSLTSLFLSKNWLTDESVPYLNLVLENNNSLTEINLENNQISQQSLKELNLKLEYSVLKNSSTPIKHFIKFKNGSVKKYYFKLS